MTTIVSDTQVKTFLDSYLHFFQVSNSENLSPQVLREVAKQLHVLQTEAPEGIKIFVNEGDMTDIQASIEGPGKLAFFKEIQSYVEIILQSSASFFNFNLISKL